MFSRSRARSLWSQLSQNYWTVPGSMVAAAVGLSFLLPWVDHTVGNAGSPVPDWLYGGGPEGARVLLSTIAGSMITVAALTFSITIVGLSTASQQFGPRLIRNFIADRGYQIVLGTFLAAFVYCLLVLRTVRSGSGQQFVPYVSVAVGIAFAVAGVLVLVYFIQHAASSLRAENLVARTGRELRAAIEEIFPPAGAENDEGRKNEHLPEGFPSGAREIAASGSGYIQAIDQDGLVALAEENDLILRLQLRVGHFVTRQSLLVEAWPKERAGTELEEEANKCFLLGTQRSLRRDVESAVDQLVEIAVRSLSPGINDPDTAVACIDQLIDAIGLVGQRTVPPALLRHQGEVRLITYPLNHQRLVDDAFSSIRQYGRNSVPVILRLLEGFASLSSTVEHDAQRRALLHQATMVWRGSRESVPEPDDLKLIERRFEAVERAFAED